MLTFFPLLVRPTMATGLLLERRDYCAKRLEKLRDSVSGVRDLAGDSGLSIYVTGSYGRLEAHQQSDLDLFLMCTGHSPLPRTTKLLVQAELIRIASNSGFPAFSNDAQYLEIHSLPEMLEKLGGPDDDSENFFTARMLLLLESRPIFGESTYRDAVQRIIEAYFRDFHDHTGDFRPLFLVNDILRFWKTLCLNYENRRNRTRDRENKSKHHLKNLKLKFSRLLICFSTVIPLVASRASSREDVFALTGMAPLERLKSIAKTTDQQRLYAKLEELYGYFLGVTARADILEWIDIRENRRIAFPKGDEFGSTMFSFLISSLKSSDDIRYLII